MGLAGGHFSGSTTVNTAGGATSTGREDFVAVLGQTQFVVGLFTLNLNFYKVYVNGAYMEAGHSAAGQTVTFAVAMGGGETVTITN